MSNEDVRRHLKSDQAVAASHSHNLPMSGLHCSTSPKVLKRAMIRFQLFSVLSVAFLLGVATGLRESVRKKHGLRRQQRLKNKPKSLLHHRQMQTKSKNWSIGKYDLIVQADKDTYASPKNKLKKVVAAEINDTINACKGAASNNNLKTVAINSVSFDAKTSTFKFKPKLKYSKKVVYDAEAAKCVKTYFSDMESFLSVLQGQGQQYVKNTISVTAMLDGVELDAFPDSSSSSTTEAPATQPNIILIQPDDLPFFDEDAWMSPPKNPLPSDPEKFPNGYQLKNMERLRSQGVQMKQAYTVSSVCGTSRYSTITGKYPSRSAFSRKRNKNNDLSKVTIPITKLEDVGQDKDCSEENMAALLKANGYRTGMTGKWHLSKFSDYTYDIATTRIKGCGFDFADGIFVENLDNNKFEDHITHNMEWVTGEAIKFIRGEDGSDPSKPFFMYFNPTVPHSSGNVLEALEDTDCKDTPKGKLSEEPVIKGMTKGSNCKDYRKTVMERAGSETSNAALGSIWVDDSLGALIQELEDQGIVDNTIILFQIDHGMGAKGSIFEGGSRILQFIHYPNEFGTNGLTFNGLVANIDIAPTMMDYAGFLNDPKGKYDMDGISWKDAIGDSKEEANWENDRCLLFELDFDRAVRCGCEKYMLLDPDNQDSSGTYDKARRGYPTDTEMYFNLCDENKNYINYPETTPEETNTISSEPKAASELREVMQCFLSKTDPKKDSDYDTQCSKL